MAKKPAITGLARPEGILDDVVYPIVQKAAKKVKARGVEELMRTKRIESYAQKGNKAYRSSEKATEKMYNFFPPTKRTTRKIEKGRSKYHLNSDKIDAVDMGRSVRKTAKRTRKDYR